MSQMSRYAATITQAPSAIFRITSARYMNLLRKAARGALSVGSDIITGVVAKLLSQYLGVPGA